MNKNTGTLARIFLNAYEISGLVAILLLVFFGGCNKAPSALVDSYQFKGERKDQHEVVPLPRAAAEPRIDGILDDLCWKPAYQTNFFTPGGGQTLSNSTDFFATYDLQNLYLGARCNVADTGKLKVNSSPNMRSNRTWGDDCVDLKISPDGEKNIYQLLVSAAGSYDDYLNGDAKWDPVWSNAVKIGKGEYTVEMAIPLKELGVTTFRPGTTILLNIGRVDRTTNAHLTSLAAPYVDLDSAPSFILGTAADYQALLASGVAITTNATIAMYLDRDQYPSFQKLATGRIKIRSDAPVGSGVASNLALVLALKKTGREIGKTRIEPIRGMTLDFDLPIANLAPGAYELQAALIAGQETLKTQNQEFIIQEKKVRNSGRIPITIPPFSGETASWPLTFGVPFPWGALDLEENVQLIDDKKSEVPIQTRVTSRWSKKGSIRWLLVDCLVPARREEQKLTLIYGPDVRRSDAQKGLKIEQNDEKITIDTGAARFVMPKRNTPGLSEVWLDKNADGGYQPDERLLNSDRMFGPYLVDEAGKKYLGSGDHDVEVILESAGPLKACVRVSGWHVAESGERLGKFILRYYAYAGQPWLRVYHTFIITAGSNADSGGSKEEVRYRDIAYSLPFTAGYCFMGTPSIYFTRLEGKDSSAYLLQRDDLLCKIYKDGKFEDKCGKAEGWMAVGSPGAMLTIAVKDFWQNFPKELEVTPQQATIHFWPAHGEEPVHTSTNISIRNIYPLWFAHEGKLLDFKIPRETLDVIFKDFGMEEEKNAAPVANAIGLAKTHEFLLYFHSSDWEKARSRTISRLFQGNPTALCDPEWICNSEVFGSMAPRNPDKFPAIERATDETIANIFRQQEMSRDYGMFNFGDAHHNWNWAERRWGLHRIWRNTHHGWTRWPWLQFARSGSKDLFDWADRNARHVADIDHCHYTTKEFAVLNYPKGKIVGGICDYKGFVHWSSGNRLCYNSIADSMLHHYYFTGDERSRATALEHGAALVANGKPQPHREGAGRATSATELYFYTWDNDYLEFLERTIDCLLKTQDEAGSFPQWENFAPFLQRYVDLTQSRRGMQAMARWADAPRITFQAINVRSYAYLYTGDIKYLPKATYYVHHDFVDSQYLGEDPRYRGLFYGSGADNMEQSYFLQWIPYYLFAVARNKTEPEPWCPEQTRLRVFYQEKVDGKDMYVFRAQLAQKKDAPFKIRAEWGAGDQSYIAEITAPGKAPIRAAGKSDKKTPVVLELDVPVDSACEYTLRIASDKSFFVTAPLAASQDNMKEVYFNSNGKLNVGNFRLYFDLPEGAQSFRVGYRGRSWPLRFDVFDPDGKVVATDTWIGVDDPTIQGRWLECPVEGSRNGWSFAITGYGQGTVDSLDFQPAMPARPFWFSLSREKLFSPSW